MLPAHALWRRCTVSCARGSSLLHLVLELCSRPEFMMYLTIQHLRPSRHFFIDQTAFYSWLPGRWKQSGDTLTSTMSMSHPLAKSAQCTINISVTSEPPPDDKQCQQQTKTTTSMVALTPAEWWSISKPSLAEFITKYNLLILQINIKASYVSAAAFDLRLQM